VSNGEEFIQELFEEEHFRNIILQCSRLRTKVMMKRKGKALVDEYVKKSIKKKQCVR
jgi:hypothetical protein